MQDLPDVEGDRKYNIQTFATQLGVRNISLLVRSARHACAPPTASDANTRVRQAIGMLLASYGTAIALALRMPGLFNAPVMAGGHAVLALLLVVKARACALPASLPRCLAALHARVYPAPPQTLDLEHAKYAPAAIQAFYRFIWTLLYSEYVLLPFI